MKQKDLQKIKDKWTLENFTEFILHAFDYDPYPSYKEGDLGLCLKAAIKES